MRTLWEFIFSENKHSDNITLSPRKGASMRYWNFQWKFQSDENSSYGQQDITFVDFPGEYDIHGHIVLCYATDDLLHYIVTVDSKRYAIIQNSEVIGKENFDQIDIWVVADVSIQAEIERQELEGIVQLMDDLQAAAVVAAQQKAEEAQQRAQEKAALLQSRMWG